MSRPHGVRAKVMDEIIRLFINPFTEEYYAQYAERPSYETITDDFFGAGHRVVSTATLKHAARIPGRLFKTGKKYVKTTRVDLPRGTKIIFALDKDTNFCKIELEDGKCYLLKEKEWEVFRAKLHNIGNAKFEGKRRRARHRD